MQSLFRSTLLTWATSSLLATQVHAHARPRGCGPTLERDVVVVGGGSGGTYAAVGIAAQGKSVAVIEIENRLGGNVATYTDPGTNQTTDYGVILYSNTSTARNYFAHLGVPIGPYEGYFPNGSTKYLDYTNGNELPYPVVGNVTAAQEIYLQQMQRYGDLFSAPGYFLPDPVPEDLLLPWGEWLEKYNATAMAYQVFYEQAGNALELPTLYIMKYFSVVTFTTGRLYTVNRGNQIIYNTAYDKLGGAANVLLESHIQRVTRSEQGVELAVKRPCGVQTVRAKKLVIAIRPRHADLAPWLDLRPDEARLTRQFAHINTWTCILNGTGLPLDTGYQLVDPTREAGIPPLPETLGISQSGIADVEARAFWWSTAADITPAKAASLLLRTAYFVQGAQNVSSPAGQRPTVNGLLAHAPYLLHVSSDAVAAGFYRELNGLQGRHSTFWTGSAWESESSEAIWRFTEQIMLPALMASLG
ncbi:hypothetical protein PG997_007242 [Apiospora hydei]|uniref:Uncharacterized protein n=1 Tax=Apiospora hydei TaxID=1337664 RepID=A0ABR1W7G6_9PEZI